LVTRPAATLTSSARRPCQNRFPHTRTLPPRPANSPSSHHRPLDRPRRRLRRRLFPTPLPVVRADVRKPPRSAHERVGEDKVERRDLVPHRSHLCVERLPEGRGGYQHINVSWFWARTEREDVVDTPSQTSTERRVFCSPPHSLSWSDTTASTVGRLLGRHSPSLPSHVPFLPFLPFSSRKSSAGFAAAALTGFLIAVAFWWNGSHDGYGPYSVLDDGVVVCGKPAGLWVSAAVLGVGGAVVEALGGSFRRCGLRLANKLTAGRALPQS
jgi:diacylglycerol kinase (CTP)